MEAMVRGKTAEHQGEVDEHLKAQQARLLMVQEKQRLQSRCLDLKQRALPAFMPQSTGSTSILCIYIYNVTFIGITSHVTGFGSHMLTSLAQAMNSWPSRSRPSIQRCRRWNVRCA